MKKTLIALAALTAVGAASAQATLSGKVGFGFEKIAGGAGDGTKQGFQMTDGEFTVAATEDLGGGLKATAKTTVEAKGRQSAPATKDATITLSGGFGSLTMGSLEHTNPNKDYGFGGAPIDTAKDLDDGGVLASKKFTADTVVYVSPTMGGFNFIGIYADDIGADIDPKGSGPLRAVLIGATYADGPLSARLDWTSFDSTTAGADFKRTRIMGSYDFGMVKVGAGFEDRDTAAGNAAEGQYVLGVSAPVGNNVKVGVVYASDDATDRDVWAVGVDYNFSKRTYLNFSYGSWDDGTNVTSTSNDDEYSIKLIHKF